MANHSLQGVTAAEKFLSCNSKEAKLFSVNPGVPAVNALEMATCFLDDALNAMGIEENPCFAAQRCIEFARAVIDSVIKGGMAGGVDPAEGRPSGTKGGAV